MTRAFRAALLLTGERSSAGIVRDGVVVVDDNRITAVGAASDIQVPPGAEVTDLGDATLLPGLVDCHTHWMLDGSNNPRATVARENQVLSTLRIASHAAETLRCGVTSVRDLGCPHGIAIAMREVIAAGMLDGPRVVAAGHLITITGGHGSYTAREADGADDVRKAVREQIRDGADLIKLIASGGVYMNREDVTSTQFTLDELRAAVDEARMADVKVAVHAEGPQSIEHAIEVGADTVEHGQYIDEELARRMVDKNVALCPTIEIFHNIAERGLELGAPGYAVEKAKEIVPVHKRGFQTALEAGVHIVAGTDVGGPLMYHHDFPMQHELEVMVAYGMGVQDAIVSATSDAAAMIGVPEVGTLRAGYLADVIACRGSVLEDVSALESLALVMKDGVTYTPANEYSRKATAEVALLGR